MSELDDTKKEFTEANMFEIALDYMEKFQTDMFLNGCIDPLAADKFLTGRIEQYRNEN